MAQIHKLTSVKVLRHDHPLHWANFWPDLERLHRKKNEARQNLILWLSNLHHGALRSGHPRGFCQVEVRLSDLRDYVRDYRVALDHFFEVKQLGYFLDKDAKELSVLIPKHISREQTDAIDNVVPSLRYEPGPVPDHTVISKVYLAKNLNYEKISAKVRACGRPELIPELNWLLHQDRTEFNFHFERSGKLKLRDTSVWPISAIETWPSWLRTELFGAGIDLDSAYVQFLMSHVREVFAGRESLIGTIFPDLIRLLNDKENFREELCVEILGVPFSDENRAVIKKVIMCLANGSKISPSIMASGTGFSVPVDLINKILPEINASDAVRIGTRLKLVTDQFASARKYACMHLLKMNPTRKNVKAVFSGYFEWERKARYALWEACDQHGIMVHDGIEGIPLIYLQNLPHLIAKLDLKLTAGESVNQGIGMNLDGDIRAHERHPA